MARDGVQAFLLSAAHCGSAPNSVHNGVGVPIGSVAGTVRSFQGSDTMLINVSLYGSSVYDGPWDNPTNSTDTVIGSTNNYANDQVCTSGSFSGVRCGIVVTNPNATVNLGGYFITEVYAQRTAHRRHNGRRPRGGTVADRYTPCHPTPTRSWRRALSAPETEQARCPARVMPATVENALVGSIGSRLTTR